MTITMAMLINTIMKMISMAGDDEDKIVTDMEIILIMSMSMMTM